ncbi:MAG: MaoC family dehydratase [Chloroflexota bacterium]|nr:MaoC family dehydratase [Chloroflexota bacterium]
MAGRYYEDFRLGEVIVSPETYEVTRDNVRAFAVEFDPQPMHLEDAAAQASVFGELTASGWQTLAATMRMMVLSPLFASGEVVGVGIDKLRWLKPVLPGYVLTAQAEILEMRPSKSRSDRGYLRLRTTTYGPDRLEVATQEQTVLVPRRP